jgi:hypothetical protein
LATSNIPPRLRRIGSSQRTVAGCFHPPTKWFQDCFVEGLIRATE